MFSQLIETPLNAVSKVPDLIRSARANSLVEYTRVTRVEPVVLFDKNLIHVDYIGDIAQALNKLMLAYYLQSVAISQKVGKVDIVRVLGKLNPDRDPLENAGMMIGVLAEESYKFALPLPNRNLGIEAYGDDTAPEISGVGFGRDTTKLFTETANLSVGTLANVEIHSGDNTITIPVQIRLISSLINPDNLTHILSVGSKNTTVKERYHAWRSGQLTFIKDMILCQDLIDDHRRTLMNDSSGMYKTILARRSKNKLASLLSGDMSVATASNMVVMDSTTALALENSAGGKLKNFKFREQIFSNTYMMIMVVVDRQWNTVTIYTRSIESPSTWTVKDIKAANKSGGTDVAEILKAYQLGNSPTI